MYQPIKYIIALLFVLFLTRSNCQFSFVPYSDIVVVKNTDSLQLPWSGGLSAPQFSNIDWDGDGKKDLFVLDRVGNTPVFVKYNNGSYDFHILDKNNFPSLGNWAFLIDYNCDGKEDIFTATTGGVKVYKNIGVGVENKFVEEKPLLYSTGISGTLSNLFVSATDIPAFYDVDQDGDIDLLTFSISDSERIEYHKNMSIEKYGTCDSLEFSLANTCWGYFREDGITNTIHIGDTCSSSSNVSMPTNRGFRHAGASVTALDLNGDDLVDVLIGDPSFTSLQSLKSAGDFVNSSIDTVDVSFPSYSTPVDMTVFPAAYYVDTDADGVKELIVAPNERTGIENYNGVWKYNNIGTTFYPNFQFDKSGFLQDQMIEVGEGAKPFLFDQDGDGLKDLLIANHHYYDGVMHTTSVAYYQNIGQEDNPSYKWITNDWQNLSSFGLGLSIYLAFGDLDNDGDLDMIIGEESGELHFFENNPIALEAKFSLSKSMITDNLGSVIDVGSYSTPFLYDYDKNGTLDLIIGHKNGRIDYYQNIGTKSTYEFKFITSNFGNILTRGPEDFNGYSTPLIYNKNGVEYLISGSESGRVYIYNLSDNPLTTFPEGTIDGLSDYNIGIRSGIALGNLNGDEYIDAIVGNYRGGVNLFMGDFFNSTIVDNNEELNVFVYPNPSSNMFYVQSEHLIKEVHIIDITGKLIKMIRPEALEFKFEISSKGLYFVTFKSKSNIECVKKLVVH